MFFSDDYLSDTEKVDRIYKMLRAERRGRMYSLVFKLSIVGIIAYGYYYLSLPEHADMRTKLTNMAQAKMTEFIMPMVGSMVQDLTQNMQVPGQAPSSGTQATTNKRKNTPTNTTAPITITPELIKAAQDILNKK